MEALRSNLDFCNPHCFARPRNDNSTTTVITRRLCDEVIWHYGHQIASPGLMTGLLFISGAPRQCGRFMLAHFSIRQQCPKGREGGVKTVCHTYHEDDLQWLERLRPGEGASFAISS